MKYGIYVILIVAAILGIGLVFDIHIKDVFLPTDDLDSGNEDLIQTSILSADTKTNLKVLCTGSFSEQYDCYADHYKKIVASSGISSAMSDLRKRYEDNTFFAVSYCHQLTHVIGRAALSNFETVPEAFKHGDSFCWSGYFHGVIEAVAENQGLESMLSNMNSLCVEIPGKEYYSFDYYNCVHGLGHGLMAISNHELFESLEMCGTLTGSWEQSSCWGGVFMENIISHGIENFSIYLKPEDPLYPCNAVNDKYKNACFLMQTSYMLKVTNQDFARVFEMCEGSNAYARTCYQSLGRDISGSTLSDVSRTKFYCLLGKDDEQRSNCIIGAVKDFISYFHSDIEAKEFCAALPAELQNTCFVTAERHYQLF